MPTVVQPDRVERLFKRYLERILKPRGVKPLTRVEKSKVLKAVVRSEQITQPERRREYIFALRKREALYIVS